MPIGMATAGRFGVLAWLLALMPLGIQGQDLPPSTALTPAADLQAGRATIPPLVPVEAFAAIPALSRPRLSPSGQFVATRMRKGGDEYLVIHPLFGKSAASADPGILRLGKMNFNWLEWVTDRYLVVSLRQFSLIDGQEVPYDRLILVTREGMGVSDFGPPTATNDGGEVVYWAPDGSFALLSTRRRLFNWPEVVRVDIPSNTVTKVQGARIGTWRWVANSRGDVVAGIGTSKQGKLEVIYRENPSGPFTPVLRQRIDGTGEDSEPVYIVRIDAETHKGYIVSRRAATAGACTSTTSGARLTGNPCSPTRSSTSTMWFSIATGECSGSATSTIACG